MADIDAWRQNGSRLTNRFETDAAPPAPPLQRDATLTYNFVLVSNLCGTSFQPVTQLQMIETATRSFAATLAPSLPAHPLRHPLPNPSCKRPKRRSLKQPQSNLFLRTDYPPPLPFHPATPSAASPPS